jgi:predicted phosphohydrolase
MQKLKLQLASDIHTEFRAGDQGRKIIQRLAKNTADEVDAILIPGDLSTSGHLKYPVRILCDLYEKVIYTPGNHEYYSSNKKETEDILLELSVKYKNFHYLNRSSVEIKGQKFVGTTLWYPATESAIKYKFNWSDFQCISDSHSWVLNEFEENRKFLKKELSTNDVVLTHFLPCPEAIHQKWIGEKSNCFFLGDVTDIILENKPKLWVFGHTHDVRKFSVGKTDFYCNPVGYPNYPGQGSEFDDSLVIEI